MNCGRGAQLRALLQRPELLVMPGGFSPLLARMCEEVGFQAIFLAGSQTSAFLYGVPDTGIIGLRDMVDHARHVAARCSIPILVDSDTGYGNAVNVHFAVEEFIRTGAAGMHIEDQEFPKKSGLHAGRRCIPVEEALGKYRAAVAARDALDPDFVICARCDLIGAEGGTFEDAIDRATTYVKEAGVDLIWMNSMHSREEIAEVCARIPAPVMVSYYGPPPTPSLDEFQSLGPAVVIFPASAASAATQAGWTFLNDLKADGPAALDAHRERASQSRWGPADSGRLLGEQMIRDIEADFLPSEAQRDYEHTFGHQGTLG